MPLLHFLDGSRSPLDLQSGELVIGSGPNCAVRLQDPSVSPEHARVSVVAGDGGLTVSIQDLDSFSGTLKNGNFVYGKQTLADGDVVQVGPFKLKYGRAAMPAAFDSGDESMTPPLGMPSIGDDDERDGRTVQMDASEIEALMAASPPPKTMPVPVPSDGPAPLPPPPAAAPAPAPLAIEPPRVIAKDRGDAAFNATLPPIARDDLERIKKQAAARRTVMGIAPMVPPKPQVVLKTPSPMPVEPAPSPAPAAPAPMPADSPLQPSLAADPPTGEVKTTILPLEPATVSGVATAKTMALEAPKLSAASDTAPIPVTDQPTGKQREDATAKTLTYVAPPAAGPAPNAMVPVAEIDTAKSPLSRGGFWARIAAFFRRLFGRR
jgi:hypothetical protein